jgi:hypothetical protein
MPRRSGLLTLRRPERVTCWWHLFAVISPSKAGSRCSTPCSTHRRSRAGTLIRYPAAQPSEPIVCSSAGLRACLLLPVQSGLACTGRWTTGRPSRGGIRQPPRFLSCGSPCAGFRWSFSLHPILNFRQVPFSPKRSSARAALSSLVGSRTFSKIRFPLLFIPETRKTPSSTYP